MNNFVTRGILILLIFWCCNLFSQTTPESTEQQPMVVVKMKDGEEYTGQVIRRDSENVVLRTANGEIHLIASNIRSIENYQYTGKYKFPNPHDTRYFFGPSGIPIKKGSGYYQNVVLTTNFVNYGITQNISIGGGLSLFLLFWATPSGFLPLKLDLNFQKTYMLPGELL